MGEACSTARRGFVLITTGVCCFAALGMLGLALDLGRLYITKNELQLFADSAALAAALELDGTAEGIGRAKEAVTANPNRWQMQSRVVEAPEVEFAAEPGGPWDSDPNSGAGLRFVKIAAAATVPLYFLPFVLPRQSSTVQAVALAGQIPKNLFRQGLFPFSPFAHSSTPPDFGFVRGEKYTLRWPASPKVGQNLCSGDDNSAWLAIATAGNGSERGYIEENSSEVIRDAIVGSYQTRPLAPGDSVVMTGGAKQTQRLSLEQRISQDDDPGATTYAAYERDGKGNGRRLVGVAINSGYPHYRVVGFALFFLLPASEYVNAANKPFCAEYVGPYVLGSRHGGAGSAGAYAVRLLE